jgi:hypothetical protein
MYEELGDTADDAELVVSELITNCLNAGARMLDLTLVGHHATVRIEATDDAAGLPEIGTLADPDEVTGRGLRIIDTLSVAWGTRPTTVGKTVWADLTVPNQRHPLFGCEARPGLLPS